MVCAFLLRYAEPCAHDGELGDPNRRTETRISAEVPDQGMCGRSALLLNRTITVDRINNSRTKTAAGGGDQDWQGDALSAVLPKGRTGYEKQ